MSVDNPLVIIPACDIDTELFKCEMYILYAGKYDMFGLENNVWF